MKMVCAMVMVCHRVRYVERPEATQMTTETLFAYIAVTSGAIMETEDWCLAVGLIARNVGRRQ